MRARTSSALVAGFVFALLGACVGDDPVVAVGPGGTDGGAEGGTATTCDASKPCAGGAPCVDGFCCNALCTGTCEACNVAGKEGTCSPVTGKPKHGNCEGEPAGVCAGSCDGKNVAECTYPTSACGAPASCTGKEATFAATCKKGTCPAAETQTCTIGCFQDTCLGVKQVAGGSASACAVMTDKHLRCWGDNTFDQLGQTTTPPDIIATPTEVNGLADVEMVAMAGAATCVLLSDKTVKCMGGNVQGELGTGTVDNNNHPLTLVAGLTDVVFISGASGSHFCAITTAGTVKCWGSNAVGQVGDGTITSTPKPPVTVCMPGVGGCVPSAGATFVAGGDGHTCAAFAGGKVACWGSNRAGELGQTPVPANSGAPNPVPTFVPGLVATYLTAGNAVTCAASSGTAKCFGSNGLGILGNASQVTSNPVPQAVCAKADCSAGLTGVTAVSTFDESACAVAGGAVKCWGTNYGGALGDGTSSTSQGFAATTAIPSGAVAVTSVGPMNMAIVVDRANRDLRCWGAESGSLCGSGLPAGERKTPISPLW